MSSWRVWTGTYVSPVNPVRQRHSKSRTSALHMPPFSQGSGSQVSGGVSHRSPVNTGIQTLFVKVIQRCTAPFCTVELLLINVAINHSIILVIQTDHQGTSDVVLSRLFHSKSTEQHLLELIIGEAYLHC